MRINDIEQAILLDQKITMQTEFLRDIGMPMPPSLVSEHSADTLLAPFAAYRHLLGRDAASVHCDTVKLTRCAVNTVQVIGSLIVTLYRSATGVDLPLAMDTVGANSGGQGSSTAGKAGGGGGGGSGAMEHMTFRQPSRAETFSGFDEKMGKVSSVSVVIRSIAIPFVCHFITVHLTVADRHQHYRSKDRPLGQITDAIRPHIQFIRRQNQIDDYTQQQHDGRYSTGPCRRQSN